MPGIFQALYTPYHIECLKQWDEAGSDNIPISLMRKQKFRKVKLPKAMAPHSSTLAWEIHGQRSLVGCSPWGR